MMFLDGANLRKNERNAKEKELFFAFPSAKYV
jgi:hypothetical protein